MLRIISSVFFIEERTIRSSTQTSLKDRSPSPNLKTITVFGLLCLLGFSFALHALYVGHHQTFGTSREVPWGILISSYAYFSCLSTGLALIAVLGQIFEIPLLKPIIGRTIYLAVISMMTALVSITLEIENPWRVPIYALLSPNTLSNIWWKTTMYSTYLVLMIANLIMFHVEKHNKIKILSGFALFLVMLGNLNLKADIALVGAKGFWSTHFMPVFFASISVFAACGAIILTTWLSSLIHNEKLNEENKISLRFLGKIALVFLITASIFEVFKIYYGMPTLSENPEAMELLLKGEFALNFWVGEVALAFVIPFIFLIATGKKSIILLAAAGAISTAGIFVMLYNLVIVGQLIPHFHEYNLVDSPKYYSYSPSLHEIMIFSGGIFFFITLFLLGERFLRGDGL